jgi:alpha-1,3-rhamnosyl/mannosyltransferase
MTGSAAARSDVVTLLGAPAGRTIVIPNGVDRRFAPQAEESVARVRESHGLPRDYALHLSSGKSHKNLDRLLQAWQAAASGGPAGGLVLAVAGGAGAERNGQRSGHGSPPPHPAVRFLGPVPEADLPALYSGARFFLFPSLFEGFGLPVLEAMACGTPVICSDASSLPEVAGDAAVLFDPRDVGSIVSAIARASGEADADLLSGMRARGLERAAGFRWEATARRCAEVYREILHEPAGTGSGAGSVAGSAAQDPLPFRGASR